MTATRAGSAATARTWQAPIAAEGDDGIGIPDVSWDAPVMAIPALGAQAGQSATVAEAFRAYAGDMGARVVNASHSAVRVRPQTLQQPITDHKCKGILLSPWRRGTAATTASATTTESKRRVPVRLRRRE